MKKITDLSGKIQDDPSAVRFEPIGEWADHLDKAGYYYAAMQVRRLIAEVERLRLQVSESRRS